MKSINYIAIIKPIEELSDDIYHFLDARLTKMLDNVYSTNDQVMLILTFKELGLLFPELKHKIYVSMLRTTDIEDLNRVL